MHVDTTRANVELAGGPARDIPCLRLANGCAASMKQDGLVNMGGFLALRDEELARRCELLLIATEGFPTYGGLAGRDLDMLAQGLVEVADPDYLRARTDMARHLADL